MYIWVLWLCESYHGPLCADKYLKTKKIRDAETAARRSRLTKVD